MNLPKFKRLLIIALVFLILSLLAIKFLLVDRVSEFYEDYENKGEPIILVNQSSRMKIAFKDENSPDKIKDAILTVWGKKMGISLDELKKRIEKGETIKLPLTFLELDEDCQQKKGLTKTVINLTKPIKLIIWDRPCGLGSSSASRIQFMVKNEQLSLMIYRKDNPPKAASISSLVEGLDILFSDGIVNSSFEKLVSEIGGFLIKKLPNGDYEPEIITSTK